MFLQTNRHTRRQFLERSMLGFGSAFLLPSLLASCTDHIIPNPQPPIIPPLGLGDYDIDWSDAAKTAVSTGLSMAIPEGGEILSALVDVFWPDDKPSAWDQVKEQVEALVDQKIGDFEYELVSEDLQGLGGLLTQYKDELNDGTNEEILIKWLEVTGAFAQALPHFQSQNYQLPLLGLFGQFANMYLSVLRDAVISGKAWGRTDADQARDKTNLATFIQQFTTYTTTVYNTGRAALAAKTPFNYQNVEPFRTLNTFDRQMAFLVLDFRDYWQYYDVTQYPQGSTALLTREIFTDPVGKGTNPDIPFKIVTPPPTQRPTQLDVWSNDYFNAIQTTYPQNSGPGGVTQTPRYGTVVDTSYKRPIPIPTDDPIIQAYVTYGDAVNTIQFIFDGGATSATLGSKTGSLSNTWGYDYEALSSVYLGGTSDSSSLDYAANFAVFGFRYWKSPAATLSAVSNLYVKSPKERSADDFAKAFPKLGITAKSITDELKAARKAYWAAVKARAKKVK